MLRYLRPIIVGVLLAAFTGGTPAHAQNTKASLNSQISQDFPNNTTGAITPAIVRTFMGNLVNSFQQYAGVNQQAGTSYTIQVGDYGQVVSFNNAAPVAVTLPQATGSFGTFNVFLINRGAGTVTVTPQGGSTINGAATLVLTTNVASWIISDGTNYVTWTNSGTLTVVCAGLPALTGDVTTPGLSCATTYNNIVPPAKGGTGVNNSTNTVTVGGNVTFSGAFATTITATNTTNSTLPAGTHTLAGLDVAETWTANQSFNRGNFLLNGTTGSLTVQCAVTCGSNTLTLPAGTTDFSATGGSNQVVQQGSLGGAFTVGQLAATNLSNGTTGTGAIVLANTPTLITPNIGVAAATSINGNIWTTGTGTLTIAAGKTGTFSNSITLAGNDGQTLTLNASLIVATNNGTLAFGAASKTLTVNNSIGISGTDGKVLTVSNSGTLAGGDAWTLAIAASKTLTVSNSLAFTGTDGTSFAFPGTSDTVVGVAAAQTLTSKALTAPTITGGTHINITSLGIRSTGSGAFDLMLANTENLTANRTLTLTVNNASRTISLSGNLTLSAGFTVGGTDAITLNGTGAGAVNVNLPTTGTLVNSAVTTLSSLVSVGTISTGVWQGTAVGLAYGGSGQTTAILARTASGFNIDAVTTFGNANYIASASDRVIATSVNFTAPRTVTLPSVASYNSGQTTVIVDSFGAINGINTMAIAAAGGDTINGLASITISTQYSGAVLWPIGSNKWGYIASAGGGGGGSVTSVGTGTGLFGGAITTTGTIQIQQMEPGGRLTLQSGVPVMITSSTAATTVYYAPYKSPFVPINNGTNMQLYNFTASATDAVGLSIALGSNWTLNSNWDAFVGLNSSAITFCTGPAWTSDTTRGTGAGTTELQLYNGLWTNKVSMTCRYSNTQTFTCGVNQCTYLGTMRTGAAGQTNYIFGAAASGGTAALFGLCNYHNRVNTGTSVIDNGASYTYTTGTTRQARASAGNQISFINCQQEDSIQANYYQQVNTALVAAAFFRHGIGLDSTTSFLPAVNFLCFEIFAGSQNICEASVPAVVSPSLGFHVLTANERGDNSNANTLNGNNAGLNNFATLSAIIRN